LAERKVCMRRIALWLSSWIASLACGMMAFAQQPNGVVSLSRAGPLKVGQQIGVWYHVAGFKGGAGGSVGLVCVVTTPSGAGLSHLENVTITDELVADMNATFGPGGDWGSTDGRSIAFLNGDLGRLGRDFEWAQSTASRPERRRPRISTWAFVPLHGRRRASGSRTGETGGLTHRV